MYFRMCNVQEAMHYTVTQHLADEDVQSVVLVNLLLLPVDPSTTGRAGDDLRQLLLLLLLEGSWR